MELRHLRYFLAVAETENVSRAALKLHVSQPALSRQIKDLEDELGFNLLERSAKSVQLTDAGRTFGSEIKAVLDQLDSGVQSARAVAKGGRNALQMGYAPSPTARILPPALRAFQTELPGIRVRLHDLSTEEMLSGIREGKLDLALMVKPEAKMLRGIRFVDLGTDTLRFAISPNHRLARKRTITLSEIVTEPLVAYSRDDYPDYHAMLEHLFAKARSRPKIIEEHDGVTSIIAAVESGAGAALLSESVACMAGSRIKLIPILPPLKPAVIGAAMRLKDPPKGAEQFIACAKRVAINQAPDESMPQ